MGRGLDSLASMTIGVERYQEAEAHRSLVVVAAVKAEKVVAGVVPGVMEGCRHYIAVGEEELVGYLQQNIGRLESR